MQIVPILPTEALRPYIRRYIFLHADGSTDLMAPPEDDPHFVDGKHVQTVFPDWGHFVFIRHCTATVDGVPADGLVVVGPRSCTYDFVTLSGWFDGLFVEFEPIGLHDILGRDLSELYGHVVPAKEMGDSSLMVCDNIFKTVERAEDIAPLLDGFFLGRLRMDDQVQTQRIRRVVEECDRRHGAISVGEMASVACLSDRQFNRIFKTHVGQSPKEFMRMRRFHMTLQHIQQEARKGPVDLTTIAVSHGYYDLSHMAMEFRAIGCVTPANFRQLGIPLQHDFSVFFG